MHWDFFQRYDESWIWRCTANHTVTESSRNFAALEECIADATLHGYQGNANGNVATRKTRGSRRNRAAPDAAT